MTSTFFAPIVLKLVTSAKLVAKIIEEARTLGYSYMRLDTLSTMESALYLYNSYGFYEIESYIYNPLEEVKYLELKL